MAGAGRNRKDTQLGGRDHRVVSPCEIPRWPSLIGHEGSPPADDPYLPGQSRTNDICVALQFMEKHVFPSLMRSEAYITRWLAR